jgi:glycosyltransferase involved in cell wall biosynthesis
LWREIYKNARAVFFVSHANAETTQLQLGLNSKSFKVINNPFQVDRNLQFSWNFPRDVYNIALVGRMQPEHKGQDLLFRALARPEWKNRNIKVNVYGRGPAENGVKAMVDYLSIAEKVHFFGHVDDVSSIWKNNQMLVMPSRHEGLPLAVVEALMCGRACLVTDVSGNIEHIEDSINGFVAAGPTVNAVNAALNNAWNNRDRWREMGEEAYCKIRQKICSDPITDFANELLLEIDK